MVKSESEHHSVVFNSLRPHGLTIPSMEFSRPEHSHSRRKSNVNSNYNFKATPVLIPVLWPIRLFKRKLVPDGMRGLQFHLSGVV